VTNPTQIDPPEEQDEVWWECPECQSTFKDHLNKYCVNCEEQYGDEVKLKECHARCEDCGRVSCECDKAHDGRFD
jgi:hypothetical protein